MLHFWATNSTKNMYQRATYGPIAAEANVNIWIYYASLAFY
jgi:hypothetical protein